MGRALMEPHITERFSRGSVGAGAPANTGAAGVSHRAGFFAGTPAPTEATSPGPSRSRFKPA
ncbi:hypothetical protein D0O09_21425 [Pseudomonas putida]|nr:hypothetical protein D0O09_21425 [Pseudomonas putida]